MVKDRRRGHYSGEAAVAVAADFGNVGWTCNAERPAVGCPGKDCSVN